MEGNRLPGALYDVSRTGHSYQHKQFNVFEILQDGKGGTNMTAHSNRVKFRMEMKMFYNRI